MFTVTDTCGNVLFKGNQMDLESFTLRKLTLLTLKELAEMKSLSSEESLYRVIRTNTVQIIHELGFSVVSN